MSAGITYNQVSSAVTNPNVGFIPKNVNDNFVDSFFVWDFTEFYFTNNNNDVAFSVQPGIDVMYFGVPATNLSYVYINITGLIIFDTPSGLRINAPTSSTPPGSPAGHLNVNVNGNNYKIQLLNI